MSKSGASPLVSVIIASYNHEKYIGEAIDSIMGQSYSNFELIISDDGSTDDSQRIILERLQKYKNDPRIICLLEEENTVFEVVEKAYSIAKGKYICAMGGDDKAYPTKLEKQVCIMEDENNSYAACFTWVDCIGDNEKRINELSNLYNRENYPHADLFRNMLLFGNYLNAPSVMMRLDLYRKYGGISFNYRQTQDYRLWLKFLLNHNIYIIQEKLTYYRAVSGSLSDCSSDMGILIRASLEKEEILCEVMNMMDSSSIKLLFGEEVPVKSDLDVKCLSIKYLLDNCNGSTEIISVALRLFYQWCDEPEFSSLLKEKYGIDRKKIYELVTDKSMHSAVVHQANNLKILYMANAMRRIAIDRLDKSDEALVEEILNCIDAGKGTVSLDHIVALYNYCQLNDKNGDDFVDVILEMKKRGINFWE